MLRQINRVATPQDGELKELKKAQGQSLIGNEMVFFAHFQMAAKTPGFAGVAELHQACKEGDSCFLSPIRNAKGSSLVLAKRGAQRSLCHCKT